MNIQLALLADSDIKKSIINVPVDQLEISEFNPRGNRDLQDIERLAERIIRNGFEITRALWAYKNETGYKVFAGGNRLEAAKLAHLAEIPIVLHENITEDEIVKLADQDNENDEYHKEVNPVDEWAHYAWLASPEGKGWDADRIGSAKGVDRTWAGRKISMHQMNEKIKDFVRQKKLEEAHVVEIMGLCAGAHFSPWLTTEQAQMGLAQRAVDVGFPTKRSIRADVKTWKKFIQEAEDEYKVFDNDITLYDLGEDPPKAYKFDAKAQFIQELKKREARSMVKVREAANAIKTKIQANLENYQLYISQKTEEAARAAIKAKQETELLSRFVLGDCLKVDIPAGIKLLLIDPPYGKNFQSNRRVKSKKADKLQNDTEAEANQLLDDAIQVVVSRLEDEAHVLVFCEWRNEPEVRNIIEAAGLKLKGSLVWVKENHSSGDLKGAFAPSHERIIHAVKGSPTVSPRIDDVLKFARSNETQHPTEKPVDLLSALINSTTNERDLIVDLFAGCGSSLLAAMRLNRDFFGIEITASYHDTGSNRLLDELRKDNNGSKLASRKSMV